MACEVNQTVDEESYHCALIANGNENPPQFIQDNSNKVNLNITGIYLIAHLFVFDLPIHVHHVWYIFKLIILLNLYKGSLEGKQEKCGKYNARISLYVFDNEILLLLIRFHMVI